MNYQDKTKEELTQELEEVKQALRDLKLSTQSNILELKQAEEALRDSEERFRVLFEGAPDAIILADPESGIITNANQAACRMAGRTLEEMTGMHQQNLHPAQRRDYSNNTFKRHIQESLDSGKTSLIENVFIRPDGTQIPVEILAQVIMLKDQRVLMGTFRDVSERKHAEAIFRDIIEKSPLSIQILDMDGYTLQTNPAHTKLFGKSVPASYSIFKDAQLLKQGFGLLFDQIKNGEVVYFPDTYFNVHDVDPSFPNVSTWIKAIGFPLNDSFGKPERVVLMHENITGRKQAENEILKLNQSLEQRVAERTSQLDAMNREMAFHLSEVEQFTYIASHDLQEPLRTLTTYTQLINEEYAGKLDADGNKYIEFIAGSASRMRTLVTALLEYSLLGKESVMVMVDCNQIMSDVLADMADSIERSNSIIRFEKLPVLNGFETELRQLFQNLINNAVKFRKKEVHPEIKISAESLPDAWRFSIEDNGIGIAEKDREKVFTIFKRMHNRHEYEGTGIGLAHCKKIVEMHGGKIWVESTIGQGSKFIFTIPGRVAP